MSKRERQQIVKLSRKKDRFQVPEQALAIGVQCGGDRVLERVQIDPKELGLCMPSSAGSVARRFQARRIVDRPYQARIPRGEDGCPAERLHAPRDAFSGAADLG